MKRVKNEQKSKDEKEKKQEKQENVHNEENHKNNGSKAQKNEKLNSKDQSKKSKDDDIPCLGFLAVFSFISMIVFFISLFFLFKTFQEFKKQQELINESPLKYGFDSFIKLLTLEQIHNERYYDITENFYNLSINNSLRHDFVQYAIDTSILSLIFKSSVASASQCLYPEKKKNTLALVRIAQSILQNNNPKIAQCNNTDVFDILNLCSFAPDIINTVLDSLLRETLLGCSNIPLALFQSAIEKDDSEYSKAVLTFASILIKPKHFGKISQKETIKSTLCEFAQSYSTEDDEHLKDYEAVTKWCQLKDDL